jgi:hypothetical protein
MDADILNYLYDNYCAEYIDLTDFIFGKFKEEDVSVYKHIRETLDALRNDGLATFENTYYINIGADVTIPGNFSGQKEFLSLQRFKQRNIKIQAKITLKGKIFVEQRRFNDQLDRTNKAIERSSDSSLETNRSFQKLNDEVIPGFNRRQIKLGNRTMIIAAISTIAIMVSVYVANQGVTSADIKLLDRQLQNNTRILDSMRQSQQGIDSSLQKAVRDSFYQKRH